MVEPLTLDFCVLSPPAERWREATALLASHARRHGTTAHERLCVFQSCIEVLAAAGMFVAVPGLGQAEMTKAK